MKLFKRREVLFPTLVGWIVMFAASAGVVMGVILKIYPFLAVTNPILEGDLVVEGWLPDDALESAVYEFKKGLYRKVYVIGTPIELGGHLSSYKTYAELGAATLRSMGMPAELVQAIPGPKVTKDRTYASVIALTDWQRANGIAPTRYHIISLGPHARRTRLLFEKAIGDGSEVGITAVRDDAYDPDRWWSSSAGVRSVISEASAYAYARLLFNP